MSVYPARIYLTGPMASGKSTVGPVLAQSLGWAFRDLDSLIEERAGAPISAIFEKHGEKVFRKWERRMLEETAAMDHCVIATGGGALVQPGSMDWAKGHGMVVYLQVPIPELVRRLQTEVDSRPLLKEAGEDGLSALRQSIKELLYKREAEYQRAHQAIRADGSPADVARAIEACYRERVSLND